MRKKLAIIVVGVFAILGLGAAVTSAYPLYTPYENYDLSPRNTKIRAPGEMCDYANIRYSSRAKKRKVILQAWVHPGATLVKINGRRAWQPPRFEMIHASKGLKVAQGWVVRANIRKRQNRFRVYARGTQVDPTTWREKRWANSRTIRFQTKAGRYQLAWDGSYGRIGVCSPRV